MTHPLDGAKLKPLTDACYDRCYVYINAHYEPINRFARSGQAVMDGRRHKAVCENLGEMLKAGAELLEALEGEPS